MITIQDIIKRIDLDKVDLRITLYPPASENQINRFERAFKIKLPEDIKAFYRFCNGFESEEDMFRIVPLSEESKHIKGLKGNEFIIAEYLVYCDYWNITSQENGQYIISHGVDLTSSFTEFLDHFLTGGVFKTGGLYEWKIKILNNK